MGSAGSVGSVGSVGLVGPGRGHPVGLVGCSVGGRGCDRGEFEDAARFSEGFLGFVCLGG